VDTSHKAILVKDIDYDSYNRCCVSTLIRRHGQLPGSGTRQGYLARCPGGYRCGEPAPLCGTKPQGQMALLINAYNLYAMDLVVSNWPIRRNWLTGWLYPATASARSPERSTGPHTSCWTLATRWMRSSTTCWVSNTATCGASGVGLRQLGGPPLRHSPYMADSWKSQLESQVRIFLSKPGNFRIDRDAMVVTLSELFDWYADDILAAGYTHIDSLARFTVVRKPSEEERAVIELSWVTGKDRTGISWRPAAT